MESGSLFYPIRLVEKNTISGKSLQIAVLP
jgi:hypothetical protein